MLKNNKLLIFILTVGVFGILNTEMGVIGILPTIAENFGVSVTQAGLLVSLFALGIAVSGPILPLVFSGMNRRNVMLLVLGIFVIGNVVSIFTTSFTVLLIARIIPALFHPIYMSLAFTVAGSSVSQEEAPKAVAKVFIGVSAGMVAGVPIVSFIDTAFSYEMAMTFIAVVNIIVFVATLIFVPSMPVKEKQSYGSQFSVLRRPVLWVSMFAVLLLNASVFGVYSYVSEYLYTVTQMTPQWTSTTLLLFGGANMLGNIIAGKVLTDYPAKSILLFPLLLGVVYIVLFTIGEYQVPVMLLTIVWGILAGGIMANVNQYLISSVALEAPDFANGLFVTSCNVGTTVGSALGGVLISTMGVKYIILVGILSVVLGLVLIVIRSTLKSSAAQTSASI
ncbi:putative MFS family arabinose efflux permease [Paenibacillus amylolyticus]|uniref:MFS family arabinose efflux permease n=1 Tax=Paenibacillus amylolyticus TaxID=1451 RepID=A0AAP5GWL0_PAEAM|nr:MFS transporter [Paenibacillus amylolyticus]MDR6721662.1 putative MFS family arabinose efflux permease [Paenibacillus amylolyticus]